MAIDPAKAAMTICEGFGLNPSDVKRIAFDWTSDDFSTFGKVTVELYVTEDQAKTMATILKEYELVERV